MLAILSVAAAADNEKKKASAKYRAAILLLS